MIKSTTKKLTAAVINAGKLTFAGKHFAKNALTVNDQVAWSLADLIKQDRKEAVAFISATLDRMDIDGVKGEPRRIVKVSLARAVSLLYDRAVKVKISERPEREISLVDVVPAASWVDANQGLLKKLAGVMEEHGLAFYDVAAAVGTVSEVVEVAATDNADIKAARLARDKAAEAESVQTYERDTLTAVLAANS